MSSVFEPSYIWNRDEEKKVTDYRLSGLIAGFQSSCFARFLSKKKESSGADIFKKSFKGKYERLEDAQLRTLKIADLDDGVVRWSALPLSMDTFSPFWSF